MESTAVVEDGAPDGIHYQVPPRTPPTLHQNPVPRYNSSSFSLQLMPYCCMLHHLARLCRQPHLIPSFALLVYGASGGLVAPVEYTSSDYLVIAVVTGEPAAHRGRRILRLHCSRDCHDIVGWMKEKLRAIEEVLDPNIAGQCKPVQAEMLLMLRIAVLCTAKIPKDRPSMRDVLTVTMLGEPKPRRKSSNNSLGAEVVAVKNKPVCRRTPAISPKGTTDIRRLQHHWIRTRWFGFASDSASTSFFSYFYQGLGHPRSPRVFDISGFVLSCSLWFRVGLGLPVSLIKRFLPAYTETLVFLANLGALLKQG